MLERSPLLFVLATLLLTFSTAGAETYRWVDDSGAITFKDTPPPAAVKKKKKIKVYRDSDFDAAPVSKSASSPAPVSHRDKTDVSPVPQPAELNKERFNGKVEIYVTDWCGYCKQAISYMTSKGIPYVAYNIEKDSAAKQRHKELGGKGVPLIIIGNNKAFGYSKESLEYFLNNP